MNHFYESIDGWANYLEIYAAAVRDAVDGAVLVELGSWYGRSASFMAVEIANSGKKVDFYCVDTWQGSVDTPWMADFLAARGGSAFPYFQQNLQRGGVWEMIKPIQKPSVCAAADFAPESIDFIMIDGAHDFANVRDDVRVWLPKVKRGGVMAGDDADWPGVMIGVHETIPMSELAICNGGANWLHRKDRPARGEWVLRKDREREGDFVAVIPFVNRPDLLEKAVFSIRELWDGLIVIDQSADGLDFGKHPWLGEIAGCIRTLGRSMSFTQMMNWASAEASQRQAQFLVFMHNDAECLNQVAGRVLDFARANPPAGVVFTYYDAFAVFRVEALKDVGPWDETFGWYFADNDYYRRMQLRHWKCLNFGGQEIIHHGSQTLHSDGSVAGEVAAGWKWHDEHYRHKWGGPSGAERFSIPYNGRAW